MKITAVRCISLKNQLKYSLKILLGAPRTSGVTDEKLDRHWPSHTCRSFHDFTVGTNFQPSDVFHISNNVVQENDGREKLHRFINCFSFLLHEGVVYDTKICMASANFLPESKTSAVLHREKDGQQFMALRKNSIEKQGYLNNPQREFIFEVVPLSSELQAER